MLPETNDLLTEDLEIEVESTKTFKLEENKINGFIDELEALKQTVYMILNTERYDYIIYSWDYGIELKDLFGEPDDYVCAELEERINEALTQDDRINNISNFEYEIERDKIKTTFTVNSIYGDVEIEKAVDFNVL